MGDVGAARDQELFAAVYLVDHGRRKGAVNVKVCHLGLLLSEKSRTYASVRQI
jgi:hypothetical protein